MVELLEEKGEEALGVPRDFLGHAAWGSERMRAAFLEGDIEKGFIPCGQVIGRIEDIPTCRELIERIVEEARRISAEVSARLAGR